MAAFDGANSVTKAALDTSKFVPEIWTDEVVATYKKNLVFANLIKRLSVVGKKGDTVHLPGFTRKSANAKTAGTAVTIIQHTGTGVSINLDQHWEYSALIEDLAKLQANTNLRGMYTEDAGYALARRVDDHLHSLTSFWDGGSGTAAWNRAVIGGDGNTLYTSGSPNATAITDAGIRRIQQKLDDNDVPLGNRSMVMPPVSRNSMLAIDKFTAWTFRGEAGALKTGKFGEIYGMEVYVTSNCPTATGGARIGAMFHKDALVLCEQQKPRAQSQYKQEFLADLLTVDMVYGAGELRDNAGIAFAVPA